MDAVALLTKQHKEAETLFKQIEASSDSAEKQRLLDEVMTALKAHTKIEEEVLYPVLRNSIKGGTEMFEEAMQEHEEAKKAMKKLESLTPGEKDWQDHFEILMHGVLHHAKEEEAEMFPRMQEELSADKLGELGEQMEANQRGEIVIDLPKEELLEQAKAADIDGRSSMNKSELEEALGHR
ncbi:MAG: hemerythrin domain-containing protein [Acidimicrobiales bacterium]|nr:hemerythrin domain-containing protein [Acidimicrobiales bacterium]